MKLAPTIDDLAQAFEYDPKLGVFWWRCGKDVGSRAGHFTSHGYEVLTLRGTKFYAHRVAWAMAHGEWPKQAIDHANGVKSDNRLSNLRQASVAENNRNRPYRGVHWLKKKSRWRVQVRREGRVVWVGEFKCFGRARKTYVEHSRQNHGEFSGTLLKA